MYARSCCSKPGLSFLCGTENEILGRMTASVFFRMVTDFSCQTSPFCFPQNNYYNNWYFLNAICFIGADAQLILKRIPTLITEVKYFSDFSLNKWTLPYVSVFCVCSFYRWGSYVWTENRLCIWSKCTTCMHLILDSYALWNIVPPLIYSFLKQC